VSVAIDVRAGAPAGRSHHIALQADGNIQVFDVWESQEAFEAFGATLIPILTGLGVDLVWIRVNQWWRQYIT
jgi:hypothetical protein